MKHININIERENIGERGYIRELWYIGVFMILSIYLVLTDCFGLIYLNQLITVEPLDIEVIDALKKCSYSSFIASNLLCISSAITALYYGIKMKYKINKTIVMSLTPIISIIFIVYLQFFCG